MLKTDWDGAGVDGVLFYALTSYPHLIMPPVHLNVSHPFDGLFLECTGTLL